MDYIAFYISSHGFGHLTRNVAIIKNILELSKYNIYIACDKPHLDFAKKYLINYSNRIIYSEFTTDIGLINYKNSLKINILETKKSLNNFIKNIDNKIKNEVKNLSLLNIKLIINDITLIGIEVGKNLNIPIIQASNFTWYHQYKYLNISENIINFYKNIYKKIDYYIEYIPSLDHNFINTNIDTIGFISRKFNTHKIKQIKEKYNKIIFISCGKSANLSNLVVKNFDGTVIYTDGIDVTNEDGNSLKLSIDTLDTHNYLAASDIAIIKSGWSSVAEALISHTKTIVLNRDVLEDNFIRNYLLKYKYASSIDLNTINIIDYNEIKRQISNDICLENLNKIENDLDKITNLIFNYIKKL
ncbi:hypothetical protein EV215_0183 [Hypnocyclicus thermotrophus]|uniref:Glycosyl transferase family 28 C-terminal domain-containing protein n=1 Tax=Hypnocyclicus thermotrophus TaxID=1627895 RepID=A0AA46E075_9FUSO|nr:hypothetical protein [Hypnocyclicus thermotrophus]TDT72382.1 hypothetical protein EV215_0183 [Hypnocyclicus thermotrophus]